MDRRKFIKRASAAAAGSFVLPYILPSGRLFAASGGGGLAQHVVLVMFAGGVRQQTVVFLLPLILYALSRVGWRRFVRARAYTSRRRR